MSCKRKSFSSHKEEIMADTTNSRIDPSHQGVRAFQEAVQTAASLQQDSVKHLQLLGNVALPVWQTTAQTVVHEMVALAQMSTEETLQAMERNLRASMELWQESFDVRPEEGEPKMQDKITGIWKTMMKIVHTNTEAAARANQRLVEAWAHVGRVACAVQSDAARRATKTVQAT